jgi:hypothetical protein
MFFRPSFSFGARPAVRASRGGCRIIVPALLDPLILSPTALVCDPNKQVP